MKLLLMVIVLLFLVLSLTSDPVLAANSRARVLENAGKTFTGTEDPAYQVL